MALSANTVWEVRTDGNDANGGGFVTGASGTDRSQQAAAHVVIDGVTITCTVNATTTKLDIVGYTTIAADVGNIVQISGGTMTAGLYQITAQTGGTQWTVDRSAGVAAQTGTGNMGGAFATPGKAAVGATVSGHKIYVKAATYTITTATPGAAGPVAFATNINTLMEGYEVTRGDRTGTRPILSWGAVAAPGATTYLFACVGAATQVFMNLKADGNSVVNVGGFNIALSTRDMAIDCVAVNCNDAGELGFNIVSGGRGALRCYAESCTTGFGTGGYAVNCTANSCGVGFNVGVAVACLAYNCTGDGFSLTTAAFTAYNCTADSNGGDGFDLTGNLIGPIDCLSTNNTGYGYNTPASSYLINCGSYNNTAGRSNVTPLYDFNPITITADPYTNQATADYRANNAGTGGALAKAAALGVFGQTNHRDIGAVQALVAFILVRLLPLMKIGF